MNYRPKLRFRGYDTEWEQRKLEDYLDVSNAKNRDNTYDKEDVLSVSGDFGIVNQIEFQGRSFAGASVENYGIVETGDVVYTKSPLKANPYGIIKANLGRAGIVSTLYAVYKPKENVNSQFVQIYFEQDIRMNNYMHPLVNKGAKNDMKVSAENALKGYVTFPTVAEQIKIVEQFKALDKLITLHQKKYDKLQGLKKSYLSEMFPLPGEKQPRRRFKGFTGDWVQRKLGDCCREFKSGSFIPANEIEESGDYPVFGGNGLRGYTTEYNHDGEFALIGRQGALCGNMNYSTGKAYFTEHAVAVQANESAETKFMYYLLGKMNLGQYSDQSAQPGLAVGKLVKMEEFFPSVDEQKKIGSHLASIDNLIALHQRKLAKLQALKKAYLTEMFP